MSRFAISLSIAGNVAFAQDNAAKDTITVILGCTNSVHNPGSDPTACFPVDAVLTSDDKRGSAGFGSFVGVSGPSDTLSINFGFTLIEVSNNHMNPLSPHTRARTDSSHTHCQRSAHKKGQSLVWGYPQQPCHIIRELSPNISLPPLSYVYILFVHLYKTYTGRSRGHPIDARRHAVA